MKILFLLTESPYPARSGPHHHTLGVLKAALSAHQCEAIGFYAGEQGATRWHELQAQLPTLRVLELVPEPPRLQQLVTAARCVGQLHPLVMRRFTSPEFGRALKARLATGGYDLIHVDQFKFAPYWPLFADLPSLLVPYDAFSLKYHRAIPETRTLDRKLTMRYLYHSFSGFERRYYSHFTTVCPVSCVDADWLRRRAALAHVEALEIPVDEEYFETSAAAPADDDAPHLLCVGLYGAEAVARGTVEFLEQAWPRIKEAVPGARLTVWGKDPAPVLRDCLTRTPEVQHLGWVDDYRATVRSATVYLYPQACGSGIQTKVQHAMAASLPVVARPLSLAPLYVEPGREAFACETPSEMAEVVVRLLRDPALRRTVGAAAHRLMRERFSVPVIANKLSRLYQETVERHRPSHGYGAQAASSEAR